MNSSLIKLKAKDPKEIENVYTMYKSGFVLFLSKYGLPKEDVVDIYQDSIIVLIENAQKGLLDNLKADIKTYLFSIGKFKALKRLKKEIPANLEWQNEENDNEEMMEKLEAGLEKLGNRCYEILKLFYYEEKKLDEIQTLLNYEKKEVLKSQKSRCLKQLKEIVEGM